MSYFSEIDKIKLQDDLKQNGFAYLPSISSHVESLSTLETFKKEIGSNSGYKEDSKAHLDLYEHLGLEKLYQEVLLKYLREHCKQDVDEADRYFISRYVSGGDNSEAYRGHFDSHFFTIVLPIKINDTLDEDIGELVAFPAARKDPSSEIKNIWQKITWKRYASKSGFEKLKIKKKYIKETFTNYKPLIFLGRTTFHGNNIVQEAAGERLSFLCHYVDTSGSNGVGQIARRIRNR